MVRFIATAWINRTTERLFSRLTLLENFWFALTAISFLFINSFSKIVKTKNSEAKNWSYVYWTVHHLHSWIKIDQMVSLFLFFAAQHISNASTFIFRSLRLCVGRLLWSGVCWRYGVVRLGWCGMLMQAEASNQSNTTNEITQQISRKLLKMDVLTFETCWTLNNEIIKQVTSSLSIFIQLNWPFGIRILPKPCLKIQLLQYSKHPLWPLQKPVG